MDQSAVGQFNARNGRDGLFLHYARNRAHEFWTRQSITLLGAAAIAAFGSVQLLGTVLWAFAHLLANGRLAGVVLFGSFLLWAMADYVSSTQRDAAADVIYPAGSWSRDVLALVIGAVAWIVFGLWLHGPLIGVRPFG